MSSILSKPSHTRQTSFSPPFLSLYYNPCPSPSPDLLSVSIPNTMLSELVHAAGFLGFLEAVVMNMEDPREWHLNQTGHP